MTYVADPESGHFVNENHRRVAEAINEYNPELHLVWNPNDSGGRDQFAIVHHRSNGYEYIVTRISADQVDERLLAFLYHNDLARTNPLSRLEAVEQAKRDLAEREKQDKAEERRDLVAHIIKGKHYYKHGGRTYS